LLAIVSFVGYSGLQDFSAEAEHAQEVAELAQAFAQKEIDHLHWAQQVSMFLADDDVHELTVQTDDRKCAFGKWLDSDSRAAAEREIDGLSQILLQIEDKHRDLHESAIRIRETYVQADEDLPETLMRIQRDHLLWADGLRNILQGGGEKDAITLDAHRCGLGQWLAGASARSFGPAIAGRLLELTEVHRQLHQAGKEAIIRAEDADKAKANEIFSSKVHPLLDETLSHLTAMGQAARKAVSDHEKPTKSI
jgi:methyl-accepting chemotaxis protein